MKELQSFPPFDPPPASAESPARTRKLRVIQRKPLESAFELALSRSLRDHLPQVPAAIVARVREQAFREFMRLVNRKVRKVSGVPKAQFLAELERSHEKILREREQAREELERLRLRAEVFRQLKNDSKLGVGASIDANLNEGLRSLFEQAQNGALDFDRLKDEVAFVTGEIARADRERSLVDYERQIEVFERRIAKLNHSLEESEESLSKLAREKNADPGVASIYRTVQGLSPNADRLDVKRELLTRLFEANLELRQQASA